MDKDSMSLPPGLEFGFGMPFMSAVAPPEHEAASDPTSNASPALSTAPARPRIGSAPLDTKNVSQQVRESVALELDTKVADRLETVWAQGQEAAQQFLMESRKHHEELFRQVADFREREAAMEAENAVLHQILATALGQLAQWGLGGANAGSMDIVDGAKAPTPPLPEACPDASKGSSTTASEQGGGGSLSEAVSPHLGFDASPLTHGFNSLHAAPASESGGSSSDLDGLLEAPPGLPKPGTKLPEVPPFPFAPTQPVPRPSTPFSLADALGLDELLSPSPLFSSEGLGAVEVGPPGLGGPTFSPSAAIFTPFAAEYYPEVFPPFAFDYAAPAGLETDAADPADGFIFNITLRKADGCDVGLATSWSDTMKDTLHIDGVMPGGAAEAWNRQCGSSGAAEKVLLPGDEIISVNNISGPEEMRKECASRQLLRLMVVRSEGPRSAPPPHTAAVTDRFSSPLRADAGEFVPGLSLTPEPEVSAFVSGFSPEASTFVPMGMSAFETQFDPIYDSSLGLGLPTY